MNTFFIDGINPEPWTASEGSIGRHKGKLTVQFYKSAGLEAYQQAVKEELLLNYTPDDRLHGDGEPIDLEFYFWRNLATTDLIERRGRRNRADATNMQKALEDALQGVLFPNDRDVRSIRSVIVEQGADVEPAILIVLASYPALDVRSAVAIAEAHRAQVRPAARPTRQVDDNLF